MIKHIQTHDDTKGGLKHSKYESEIYSILMVYLDNKLTSVSVRPRKFPYPDIMYDIETNNIRLDFTNIGGIPLDQYDKFADGLQYAKNFAQTELIPFIKTKKSIE